MFSEDQVNQWRQEIYGLLDHPLPFARWLAERPDQFVGRGHEVEDCPIYHFLQDQDPWLDAQVGRCHIYCELGEKLCRQHGWLSNDHAWNCNSRLDYYGGYAPKETPEWLRQFVTGFDRRFFLELPYCTIQGRIESSAWYCGWAKGGEALEVLAGVAPEVANVCS